MVCRAAGSRMHGNLGRRSARWKTSRRNPEDLSPAEKSRRAAQHDPRFHVRSAADAKIFLQQAHNGS